MEKIAKNSGCFIVTTNNGIFGHTDTSKWDALKWYQKLYGYCNRRYRAKHILMKPFKLI